MFGLALIYGFLAATAALLVQVVALFVFDFSFTSSPSLGLFLAAAALEEGSRLVFLLQLAKHHPNATSLIHAFLFGIGFVVAEIALLALAPTDRPEIFLIARTALIHLLGTFIIYIGLRSKKTYPLAPLIAVILAILAHTLYNHSL